MVRDVDWIELDQETAVPVMHTIMDCGFQYSSEFIDQVNSYWHMNKNSLLYRSVYCVIYSYVMEL